MKALCVSDKVVDWIYSPAILARATDVDIVFGCGDLPYYYLEYITTVLNAPLYYVHGNHDPEEEYTPSGEAITGPGGGVDLDNRGVEINGLLVAGLQGSIRYKPEGTYQHTDAEMWLKVLRLVPRFLINRLFKGRALDVLVAHSPPLRIHNGTDHVHRGFAAFLWLMKVFKPRLLIHGHHHVYRPTEQTVTVYRQTTVTNIYPYKLLDI
ncbi:MAG: metallophosphoesterase [Anaerolineae bacterium]